MVGGGGLLRRLRELRLRPRELLVASARYASTCSAAGHLGEVELAAGRRRRARGGSSAALRRAKADSPASSSTRRSTLRHTRRRLRGLAAVLRDARASLAPRSVARGSRVHLTCSRSLASQRSGPPTRQARGDRASPAQRSRAARSRADGASESPSRLERRDEESRRKGRCLERLHAARALRDATEEACVTCSPCARAKTVVAVVLAVPYAEGAPGGRAWISYALCRAPRCSCSPAARSRSAFVLEALSSSTSRGRGRASARRLEAERRTLEAAEDPPRGRRSTSASFASPRAITRPTQPSCDPVSDANQARPPWSSTAPPS